ncbi:YeiH family protein [bacterium]|nr:YeiH family protein [bacterium]
MNRGVVRSPLLHSEDWWAVWIGFAVLIAAAFGLVRQVPKLQKWTTSPLDAFQHGASFSPDQSMIVPVVLTGVVLVLLFALAIRFLGDRPLRFMAGFGIVFVLAVVSYLLSRQVQVRAYGLEYAVWALAFGLLISNTVGVPEWLKAGARSELYIKTGLVLLGAEILFTHILDIGGPGLFVAWFVTPIVILVMFNVGTRLLKIPSKALIITIAAATSVCGVSAAIATAAAAKAKKEELTLAVGLSLIFTVLMMIFMPWGIRAMGMDVHVGAAWIGGTIDSTGAVVASGAFLGPEAEKIAAVVKMIQNVLIGVVAFLVAVYWCAKVEREGDDKECKTRPSLKEIWIRFPKFIVGFVVASVVFSFVLMPLMGSEAVEIGILKHVSVPLRGWLFCMAFVSIGLESNFREMAAQMSGGKPFILYVVGQSFNVLLTLLAAWLAFGGILFDRLVL